MTAAYRGDRYEFRSRRRCGPSGTPRAGHRFVSRPVLLSREGSLPTRGIPLLPRVLHRLAIVTGQISIGDPVVVQPGVYIPHGQVVIDGVVEIDTRVVLMPFVTIGLRSPGSHGARRSGHTSGSGPARR